VPRAVDRFDDIHLAEILNDLDKVNLFFEFHVLLMSRKYSNLRTPATVRRLLTLKVTP